MKHVISLKPVMSFVTASPGVGKMPKIQQAYVLTEPWHVALSAPLCGHCQVLWRHFWPVNSNMGISSYITVPQAWCFTLSSGKATKPKTLWFSVARCWQPKTISPSEMILGVNNPGSEVPKVGFPIDNCMTGYPVQAATIGHPPSSDSRKNPFREKPPNPWSLGHYWIYPLVI